MDKKDKKNLNPTPSKSRMGKKVCFGSHTASSLTWGCGFTASFFSFQDCRYKVIDMILIFYLQTNKTHLHKNSLALKLVLKVRIFGTQPIRPSQEANKKTIVSTA